MEHRLMAAGLGMLMLAIASNTVAAPKVTSPTYNQTVGNSFLVKWYPERNVAKYMVCVTAQGSSEDCNVLWKALTKTYSQTVSGLGDYAGDTLEIRVGSCASNYGQCQVASWAPTVPVKVSSTLGQATPKAPPAPTFDGSVTLSSPANGGQLAPGAAFVWATKSGAGSYHLCVKRQSYAPPGSGNIGGCDWIKSGINTSSYAPSPAERSYIGNSAFFWTVRACTPNNTACTEQYQWRQLSMSGGSGGGEPTAPSVSFANDLYPVIASSTCDSCHNSGARTPSLYPQKADGAPRYCSGTTIPFNTTITATEMLSRFKCLTARSNDYSTAFGKVYVVPNDAAGSGLHHKAQNSGAFSFNHTIGGQTKSFREWLEIWIEQGAN